MTRKQLDVVTCDECGRKTTLNSLRPATCVLPRGWVHVTKDEGRRKEYDFCSGVCVARFFIGPTAQ